MAPAEGTIDDMTWWDYVERISDRAPRVQVAKLVGLTPSAISRWATGATPEPHKAAALARAYDRPVLEAFVAAGFLTEQEAGQAPTAGTDPAALNDDELIAEVARRIKGGSDVGSTRQKMIEGTGGGDAEAEPVPDRRGAIRGKLGAGEGPGGDVQDPEELEDLAAGERNGEGL